MGKIIDKLLLNATYLVISSTLSIFLSLVYWLIIGKLLPPYDYGIVSTTINFASFLAIASIFGFNLTLGKLLPEYIERQENKKIRNLLNFSLKFMFFSSAAIGVVLIMFSSIIAGLMNLPRYAIILSGFLVVLTTMESFTDSTLRGFQNMKWIPIIQFSSDLTKIVTSIIMITLGFRYIGPLFGYVFLYIVAIALGFKIIHFPRKSDGVEKKEVLLKYSLPEFFARMVYYAFFSGRVIILNILKGPSVTGIFSFAIILTTPILLFPNALLQTIFPLSSQILAKNNSRAALTRITRHFIRYTLMITLPLSAFLVMFSKPIILAFSKESYLKSVEILPVIALASIIYNIGSVFHRTLFLVSKTSIYRNIMIFSVAIFLIFAVLLTIKFSALGMSYAFLIFSCVFTVLSFVYLRKFADISLPFLSTLKIILSTIVILAVLNFVVNLTNYVPLTIFASAAAGGLYLGLLVLLRFLEKDDIRLLKVITAKFRFLKGTQNLLSLLSKYQK